GGGVEDSGQAQERPGQGPGGAAPGPRQGAARLPAQGDRARPQQPLSDAGQLSRRAQATAEAGLVTRSRWEGEAPAEPLLLARQEPRPPGVRGPRTITKGIVEPNQRGGVMAKGAGKARKKLPKELAVVC